MTDHSAVSTPASPRPRMRQLRLVGMRWAAEGVCLLDLEDVDRQSLGQAQAGAHVDLALPNGLVRQYSLVTVGSDLKTLTVGVKRDATSRGGSAYIHELLRLGTVLEVSEPRCNFELNEAAAHTVLIAGGIGITPIWAMVQRLRQLEVSWELHYATRNRGEAAFLRELADLGEVSLHFDDEQDRRFLDVAGIIRGAPIGSHFYCCGPAPMLAVFEQACASFPPEQVHVEYFAPKSEADLEGGFTVRLARSGMTLQVQPGQSILDTVRNAGIDSPSACEQGVCGSCETRVLGGTPDHRDSVLTDSEREKGATMMICCSGSKSPELVLDL